MNPAAREAQAVIAHHSRSFSLAVKCLPEPARSDACIIYAWCRRADDAIDEGHAGAASSALERLRAELADVYARPSAHDGMLQAFREVVLRRGIPIEYPQELLAGMEMDVVGQRYDSLDDLLLYCHRVASTVGLMMCHVLGASNPAALRHAAHLGIAMQLTNICRDVAEDWQRGRLYLPLDLLRRHGASELPAQASAPDPAHAFPSAFVRPCREAMKELLAAADRYYLSSDLGLRYLPWRAALAVSVARRVYAAIGAVIAGTDYDVRAPRAVVPGARKAALFTLALAAAARASGEQDLDADGVLPTVQYGPDLALF